MAIEVAPNAQLKLKGKKEEIGNDDSQANFLALIVCQDALLRTAVCLLHSNLHIGLKAPSGSAL